MSKLYQPEIFERVPPVAHYVLFNHSSGTDWQTMHEFPDLSADAVDLLSTPGKLDLRQPGL